MNTSDCCSGVTQQRSAGVSRSLLRTFLKELIDCLVLVKSGISFHSVAVLGIEMKIVGVSAKRQSNKCVTSTLSGTERLKFVYEDSCQSISPCRPLQIRGVNLYLKIGVIGAAIGL